MKHLKIYYRILVIVMSLGLFISCDNEFPPERSFTPELVEYPELTVKGYSPDSGYPGSVVKITGSNFGDRFEAAKVSFNGELVTEFESYQDNMMEVIVPENAQSGKLSVQVWTHAKDVGTYTVKTLPVITSVDSDNELGENIAFPGDVVAISGSNFGTDASAITISFNGTVAEIMIPVQDDLIQVVAPEDYATGFVSLEIGGATVISEQAMINPTASGDITPFALGNTGDAVSGGGNFVRGDELEGRWGTLGAPWITNDAALNKEEAGVSLGGYGKEQWNGLPGYIAFETWGNTPIVDGKVYQPTAFELPAGSYTVSFEYYSEIQTNSSVHCVVTSGDNGIPSLADLSSSLGYVELVNDAVIGTTAPSVNEVKEFSFELETSQKVSLGFLVNMKWNDADPGSYGIVKWVKLVKN